MTDQTNNQRDRNHETEDEGERSVGRNGAQITGRSEGPYGSDDSDEDRIMHDNRHRDEVENSANGLDSVQERGGQDGRNIRPHGGIDMDSANGVLRFNDIENNGAHEVTEEGLDQAAKSNTSPVSVTTHGPDDYASDEEVPTPQAQEQAKHQDDGDSNANDSRSNSVQSQEEEQEEIARTGTSTTHQPTY